MNSLALALDLFAVNTIILWVITPAMLRRRW